MITEDKVNIALTEKKGILVKRIVEAMSVPPQAIYLVGGYGRGEGAWYEDEEGLHPYNDFDLAVITDNPLSHEKTEALRKELANEVGIKWVDIDYYSINSLMALRPTIHNVDLLSGGSLIFGEDVIKKYNLKLDASEIGPQDIITLYWTRMWTFLGSWEGPFRDLEVEEARFFKNQMAKAMLAANDMRMVKLKKYTTSYRERSRIILDEFKKDTSICELTEWAINEKMRPSSINLRKNSMERIYFSIKDEFINAFEYSLLENAMYFLNPSKTKCYYLWHTKNYLRCLKSLLKGRKSNVIRSLDTFYAMNFVFHSNHHGRIDKKMLKQASNLLIKHNFIKETNSSWDELRLLTANARNNI